MSSSNPLISVCIPAYNNEKFIKQTIDCILNQTYKNWELVISDDCSKDKTVEIIKTYNDPRIRLIERESNLGLGGNWNSLIPELKGEYVKLVCGDDLISHDCLEKQVNVFLSGKYPNAALVASATNLIDEKGKKLFSKKFPFKSGLIKAKTAVKFNYLFGKNVIGEPGSGLVKRETYNQITKNGESYYDASNSYLIDMDFWFRVLLTGDLYFIPETLAYFRLNKQATTTKMKNNQAELFIRFAKKYQEDKRFGISKLLLFIATINAKLMQFMRSWVLKLYVK